MKQLVMLIFLFMSVNIFGQQTIKTSQLNGTTWLQIEPSTSHTSEKSISFDMNIMTRLSHGNTFKFKYYIETYVPETFQDTLVGKNKTGDFLIFYNDKSKVLQYYQIHELTNTKLVLLRKGKPNSIGGGHDLYITYKRVY